MKKNKKLKAALLYFQAEKARSEANLEVYLKSSAGVGEHPDFVAEVINLTKAIAESEECIRVLNNIQEKK